MELRVGYRLAKASTNGLNRLVDTLFVLAMLLLLLVAIWTFWDARQIYAAADPNRFIQYKPDYPEDVETFEDLQAKNPDVKAWLTIYDTKIDYPLVQTDNDDYYMNHDVFGEIQASGSLFIDYRNNERFQDFNTIIYGHHMSERKMFGDIDLFLEEDFFNKHEFGNLYDGVQNRGLEIVAILEVDSHDPVLYYPAIDGEELRLKYIDQIYNTARFIRGVSNTVQASSPSSGRSSPLTPDDHILLLSTCSADITNGRFILVCKLLDHAVGNPFPETEETRTGTGIDSYMLYQKYGTLPFWAWVGIIILLIILTFILYRLSRRRDRRVTEKASRKGDDAYDQEN